MDIKNPSLFLIFFSPSVSFHIL